MAVFFTCFFFASAISAFADYTPPKPVGYVNDFAHILTQETRVKLDSLLVQLKSKTGAEVVVVTLSSLDGQPIEDVGLSIGRSWKVGQIGKDNGLIVVVAPNERKMRIEVGYGLEGVLPDSKVGRIRDEYMRPYFKQGDYNSGIFYGTQVIAQTIATESGVTLDDSVSIPAPQPSEQTSSLASIIMFVLFLFMLIKYPSFTIGFLLGSLGGRGESSGSGGFGGFSGSGGFGGGGCSGGW